MCMVLDDSLRANYVTSSMTFYLRLGRLLRRFWRLTERTLECNKCSVEYVQHFCYVLRFAPSLRFTLWFVHNDIWSSKEFSGNQHQQNMQKNSSNTNQLSSWLSNPQLAFLKWMKNSIQRYDFWSESCTPSLVVRLEVKQPRHCSWEANNLASTPAVHWHLLFM